MTLSCTRRVQSAEGVQEGYSAEPEHSSVGRAIDCSGRYCSQYRQKSIGHRFDSGCSEALPSVNDLNIVQYFGPATRGWCVGAPLE